MLSLNRIRPCEPRRRIWGSTLLAAFVWLLAVFCVRDTAAQPPALLHYQGRLTTSAGAPITTAQLVYFSLWSGGSDATANSGTQLYRERATLTPDSNGIVEHRIGSGTVELGTLSAALFNTSAAVYLQVAPGNVSAVLLPRTRVTSVGYAMVAAVAATATTATTAATAATAVSVGSPVVNAVSDATGGVTVPGDLILINGSGLANALVSIGGKPAPLKTRTATQIVAQVPAGLANGLQPVAVLPSSSTGPANAVGQINLQRLALVVQASAGSADAITVINTATRTVLTTIDPTQDIGNVAGGQIAFAQNGALALVPGMTNRAVIAIDMTANPPAVAQTLSDSNLIEAKAVAASPDGQVIAVSSSSDNRVRVSALAQQFPPYTTAAINTSGITLQNIPSGSGPQGLAFAGNGLLLVSCAFKDPGVILGYRRTPTAATLTAQFASASQQVQVGTKPQSINLTPDGTRAVLATRSSSNVAAYYLEPDGLSTNLSNTGPFASAGSAPLRNAIAPDGVTILTANPTDDQLMVLALDGGSVRYVGEVQGASDSANYQVADIEPVTGDLALVGTDNGTSELFARAGGALHSLATFGSSASRVTVDVRFQP